MLYKLAFYRYDHNVKFKQNKYNKCNRLQEKFGIQDHIVRVPLENN